MSNDKTTKREKWTQGIQGASILVDQRVHVTNLILLDTPMKDSIHSEDMALRKHGLAGQT